MSLSVDRARWPDSPTAPHEDRIIHDQVPTPSRSSQGIPVWRGFVPSKGQISRLTFASSPPLTASSVSLLLISVISANQVVSLATRFILCFLVASAESNLAQYLPRRKHETVHRSSSWGVRIRPYPTAHLDHDLRPNADPQAGHFP